MRLYRPPLVRHHSPPHPKFPYTVPIPPRLQRPFP
jgi:hypothetical protein